MDIRREMRKKQRSPEAAVQQAERAAEVVASLTGSSAHEAAVGCKAIIRLRSHAVAQEAAVAIIKVLKSHAADAEVAAHGCWALAHICKASAMTQQLAVDEGAFDAVNASLEHHPAAIMPACAALEAMCTGVGAASRRERAREAGVITSLMAELRSSRNAEKAPGSSSGGGGSTLFPSDVTMACCAALRSITRDSMQLQQAALDEGASVQWLV
uniref:Uncharacterized protein n=1 Tax=Coccolithus braarudii TaxID=221442 RepID=A0A7S0PYS6_9EUKA